MHVAVLFVLGGALFDAGARSVGCGGGFFGRLASLAWSLGLVVATVWAAGEWRRSRRAAEKRDFESYRVGHEAGKKYVASSGSDELNWFDYAMQVFYARYCSDEKLLSNWVRVTVEAALEGLEIAGLRGITIPYLVLGQKRIHVLKTSPWRYEQRPGELYLDLTLKWFSECRMTLAFTLASLTGGSGTVFSADLTNLQFEGVLRLGVVFVDKKPWAGTLHLSFRETPSIDFDINVLSGVTGGAGMTLPIDLKKVVMTWPEKFSLPFDEWFGEDLPQGLEAQAAGTGDASETTSSKKAKKTPMAKGLICIEVIEADELMSAGAAEPRRRQGGPYVRIDVDGVVKKTAIARKTLKPTWSKNNRFYLLVNDLDTRVRLRVVDDQLLGINDKLGEFEFSVSHLMADKVMIHKQTHSPRGRRLKHLPAPRRAPAARPDRSLRSVIREHHTAHKAGKKMLAMFRKRQSQGLKRGETPADIAERANDYGDAPPPRARVARGCRAAAAGDELAHAAGFAAQVAVVAGPGGRGRPPPKRQPSTPTGVGLAGQRQPSQAAKKPSVLRSVSAKLRRPLGNVPPIGSEHYSRRSSTATREHALANNLPMGEDLKRRSLSAESAEQAGAAALTPAAAAEESKGAFSDDEPAPSLSPSSDTTATLFLAAVYVEIVEAAELAQHASRRARNAQVTATVGREKYATRAMANANHPKWEEAANFYIAGLEDPILHLTVVDVEQGGLTGGLTTKTMNAVGMGGADTKKLGELVVPLNEAHFGDYWLTLNNTPSGKIHLVVTPRYLDARTFPVPGVDDPGADDHDTLTFSSAAPKSNTWRKNVRANPTAALWQPKEDAIECMRCSELFTMRRWKHHCRACLRVYCRNCVQKRTDVPTYGNKHAMYICLSCYSNALAGAPSSRTSSSRAGVIVS
ncbi:C2 domain-containing protein [Aureococcus anophagefferens]|nr:C2 domain-containing protein [Aureococcus anophagefferens]